MIDALEKLDDREFRLLIVGLGLVLTIALGSVTLMPGFKSYRAAAAAVTILEKANEESSDLEQQLQEHHTSIEELKFRLHGDMAFVIGKLQKISWRNDVDLISVKPASGAKVQIFTEMLFNVELLGEYDDIYRWLWDAKNELGFVVVKEYAMQRSDSNDDNPRLTTTVSLASYRAEQ
jgi:hypothetical protein